MSKAVLPNTSEHIPVSVQLARIIGLNESLILQQVHYWCNKNKENSKNFHDGDNWVFQTFEEWASQLPFSVSTLKRSFKKLEDSGLLIVGNYNKMKIDRTKWYRVNYLLLEHLIQSPSCQNDTLPLGQNDTMDWVKVARAIQETIKETNVQEIKKHKTAKQVLPITFLYFTLNDENTYETNVVTHALIHYYDRYQKMMNRPHPRLKKTQVYHIYDDVLEPAVHEYELEEEHLIQMINIHFERKTDKHDYNVNAFASEENIRILYERVRCG